MPLLHFYDRATLLAALDLPLEPDLKSFVTNRIGHLTSHGLLDMTEILVVMADTLPAELVAAIGWWPTIDANGRRFGEREFINPFDYTCHPAPRWYLAVQTVGNDGFAFELFISCDADSILLNMCQDFGKE